MVQKGNKFGPVYATLIHLATLPQNLEYNVPGGKLNRGISVVDTVEILRGEPLCEKEYFEVALLGWGVELVSDHLAQKAIPSAPPDHMYLPAASLLPRLR